MPKEPKLILLRIEAVLFILLLFFSCVIILSLSILPAHGFYVCWDVTGDSMEPTIKEGAVIISRSSPYEKLEVGDIITFKRRFTTVWTHLQEEGSGDGTAEATAKYLDGTITHRIVSIEPDGIHTKGDNNEANDHYPVLPDGYESKVIWWCNYAGWPIMVMFDHGGFYWLAGATVINGVVILWIERRKAQMPR